MGDLQVEGLVKHYGTNPVVNDVSFTVMEGEFFVVLGPSGGGKSTLLRLLTGLEQAEAGKIILAGRDITKAPPRERNIGMVFQDYGLYPHMNVHQNIAYGLEARGMGKSEVDQRVRTSAEKLGLTPLLTRVIVDLSGGEQQRVALARALAKDADLFLFDEPLSNLDPKLRSQARRDIQMVHREKHRPTIYVTHDQTEAIAIGDRVGIIANGKMQQVGRPDDILDHPANAFVARFIGTPPMNLLRARLAHNSQKGAHELTAPGVSMTLSQKWNDRLRDYQGDEILLGLRPNAFRMAGADSRDISGTVIDIEPLIGESIYAVQVSDNTVINVAFADQDGTLSNGEMAYLNVDPDIVTLFDARTEQALDHGSN